LLARQIDLICAAQLTSIKVTAAAHNGSNGARRKVLPAAADPVDC
jgi:hypothetical protein